MIAFNFNIRNPWSQKFKNLWSWSVRTPWKNKFLELEVYQDSSIVSISANWTIRQSHAGLDIEFGLLGLCFHFNLYDCRHWDWYADRYSE
jgi:hypothetical protein